MVKKFAQKIPPTILAWGRMFFGSIIMGFWLFWTGNWVSVGELSSLQLAWLMLTFLFLVFYVLLWYSALAYTPVSVATAILTLGLPITQLLADISSHQIVFPKIIGTGLVLLGVGLVLWFFYCKKPSFVK